MGYVPGIGGVLTLGGVTFPVRNIRIARDRDSTNVSTLTDIKRKKQPGRWGRQGSFVLIAQTAAGDDAIRAHTEPVDLAATISASLALVYTDGGGKVTSMTVHLTSADRIDDGSPENPGIWDCNFEEQ